MLVRALNNFFIADSSNFSASYFVKSDKKSRHLNQVWRLNTENATQTDIVYVAA
jgi:hypothetical protein